MNNDERESLRRKTRYFYDLQAIRIALGNRTEDPALYTVKLDEKTGKEKKTKKPTLPKRKRNSHFSVKMTFLRCLPCKAQK